MEGDGLLPKYRPAGAGRCFTERAGLPGAGLPVPQLQETAMWTKPCYRDLRLGFEVTLYIANR